MNAVDLHNLMPAIDRRTAHDRDAEVLAHIEREGGLSIFWVCQNRDRAASVHRLIADGRLVLEGSGWIRVERPARSLREVFADLWKRTAI